MLFVILFPFLSFLFADISWGLSGGNPTMSLSESLLYPCGVFLFPFCILCQGIVQNFLYKLSRCHQTTLLVAHWPNSAAPKGPTPLLLQLFPPFNNMKGVFSVLFPFSDTVFVNGSKASALPLCCLQQWSARRIWLSAVCAFYAEVKTERLHVRNTLRSTKKHKCSFGLLNIWLLCLWNTGKYYRNKIDELLLPVGY